MWRFPRIIHWKVLMTQLMLNSLRIRGLNGLQARVNTWVVWHLNLGSLFIFNLFLWLSISGWKHRIGCSLSKLHFWRRIVEFPQWYPSVHLWNRRSQSQFSVTKSRGSPIMWIQAIGTASLASKQPASLPRTSLTSTMAEPTIALQQSPPPVANATR